MSPLTLAILLFAVAAALLIAEMLLPAHGALGVLAVCAMVGGIVLCYQVSHALALYVAVGISVAAPFVGAAWMKLWPRTPLGRRLVLGPAPRHDTRSDAGPVRVGATGVVVAELRPNGVIELAGERVAARSERGYLKAGQKVAVIAIVDGRPTVRAVEAA